MAGIYIHFPFCRNKCIYCDFYSLPTPAGSEAMIEAWIKALSNELHIRINELTEPIETIYLGGGTPSLLSETQFRMFAKSIMSEIPNINQITEYTIEVNPGDVSEEKARLWFDSGINRVSIGIQSFIDSELKKIGRRHSAEESIKSYEILKDFTNKSIDLIYGLPSQTIISWKETIETALGLRPTHISSYSLTYEEGTPLFRQMKKGLITPQDEEIYMEMYSILCDKLSQEGYERYEISNFALPGFESRHNSSYWKHLPYLGIGPGAHSYDGINERRFNPKDIHAYIRCFSDIDNQRQKIFYQSETLNENQIVDEYIMTRLRTSSGIDLMEFKLKFGHKKYNKIRDKANTFISDNHIELKDDRMRLTDSGVLIADYIILELASSI